MRLEGEATCIYCMSLKQPLRPITLVILAFWFFALVVVYAPRFLVVKEEYSLNLFFTQEFPCMVPYSSIHDGFFAL
jgi:hypothetical protein